MSKYTATGLIEHIGQTQEFNSGFTKREIVLSLGTDLYPQSVPFEVHKDKCDELDRFRTREKVEVEFVLNGREWNGRYFSNLKALRIVSLDQRDGVEPSPQESTSPAIEDEPQLEMGGEDDNEDIPF